MPDGEPIALVWLAWRREKGLEIGSLDDDEKSYGDYEEEIYWLTLRFKDDSLESQYRYDINLGICRFLRKKTAAGPILSKYIQKRLRV
jgi:hypothetical protein